MKKYIVTLTKEERETVGEIAAKGKHKSQKIINSLILLGTDEGKFQEKRSTNKEIARVLKISMKKILKLKWVILLLGLMLASASHAGVILNIYPDAIQDKDGSDGAAPFVNDNIEFFYPSTPADPTNVNNRLDGATLNPVMDGPTLLYYQYENMELDGGSLGVRFWKGSIHSRGFSACMKL